MEFGVSDGERGFLFSSKETWDICMFSNFAKYL